MTVGGKKAKRRAEKEKKKGENREKREKKDKKKRERGRAEKAIRRIQSKARKNTEARATTPPAQHAFIAITFVISRESISRRRENEQRPKPAWPICFAVPRSSNHWLSAEASAPVIFVRLSASFQEKESRTEKKGKRREENREKKGERGKQHRRTPDERRQQRTEKRASPADQVSCLLFPAFACILSCICYCSSEI